MYTTAKAGWNPAPTRSRKQSGVFSRRLISWKESPEALKYRQAVYSELAGVYFHWCDLVNVEKYYKAVFAGRHSAGPAGKMISAYQERGSYFINLYRRDGSPQRSAGLRSLSICSHSCICAMNNRERLVTPSDIPFAACRYRQYFPGIFSLLLRQYTDSIWYYNTIALEESRRTKQFAVEAGCVQYAGKYGTQQRRL